MAGVNNPVAASPAAMLNHMMQGVNIGHGNVVVGGTNGCGTSEPFPNAAAVTVQQQQSGILQAVLSALKASVARVRAAEISHEFSKRLLKGQLGVGGDDSK